MIQLSDHHKQEHNVKHDRLLVGHSIVVTGTYSARAKERGVGATEKSTTPYKESFELSADEARLHKQNALAAVLRARIIHDSAGNMKHLVSFLEERLREKDPNFQAVLTHEIAEHTNIFEAPEAHEKRTAPKP